jgi:hypothetical protein
MKKTVYVFNCSNQKMKFGLTYDKTGANLPKKECKGQWILYKVLTLEPNDPPIITGVKPEEIIDALDADGYIIHETRTTFK